MEGRMAVAQPAASAESNRIVFGEKLSYGVGTFAEQMIPTTSV